MMVPIDTGIRKVTQVDRIFAKFGGPQKLAKALRKNGTPKTLPSIYKWNYTREQGGCNGVIPSHALFDVIEAAKLIGVELSAEDLDPRAHIYELHRIKH